MKHPGDELRIASEEQLIAEFLAPLATGSPAALDLADDCALLAPPAGEELVLKTDPIVEGVHFPADFDPADIAWRALAVNVSDLAAKGARPLLYLMALSLPEAPTRGWMRRFCEGLASAQTAFGIALAGGDTDRVPGRLSIAVTVVGAVPAGRMVRRAGARAGDALYVSGTLGDAALGLMLIQDGAARHRLALTDADADYAIRRFLRPEPRLSLRPALLDHARAAMDLSDGLAKDLSRMCRASGTGARVDVASLPLAPAVRRALAAEPAFLPTVVAGGDDYEVLAAVAPQETAAFETAAMRGGIMVRRVGAATAGSEVVIVGRDGRPLELARTGWDHFGGS